jgi:hypothetical protein
MRLTDWIGKVRDFASNILNKVNQGSGFVKKVASFVRKLNIPVVSPIASQIEGISEHAKNFSGGLRDLIKRKEQNQIKPD